ncbi:MAG TPA: DUF2845 domain-containing protein [Gammaproteobacteria bacterium]|nr:DUF2845 domain-containing protein [Gammaproteobacteria bacterium]
MQKRILGPVLLAVAAWAGESAGADHVLRCGGELVRVGMVAPQVLAKCGEPTSKAVEDVPVRARGRNGAVTSVGVTRVERWTYDKVPGQFPALLTFEEGKLKSLELITKR